MAVQYCLTMSQSNVNETRKRYWDDPVEVYVLPEQVLLKGAYVALEQFIESYRPDNSYLCYRRNHNKRKIEVHYKESVTEGTNTVIQVFEIGKVI